MSSLVDSEDLSTTKRIIRIQQQMPHYWPADKVPYLKISYCHLIQGIFAVLLLSCIAYVVYGASKAQKH